MYFIAARHIGRTLTNRSLAANQSGLITLLCLCNGCRYRFGIVPIYIANHVPTVRFKTLGGIFIKPGDHLTVDRDAVVIP